MSFFQSPSTPPTPSEYGVIAVGASGLLVLLGLVGFCFRFFAAPQNPEIAAALIRYSGWSLGIGLFIGFSYWVIRRFTD
jgi:hypothetical protein